MVSALWIGCSDIGEAIWSMFADRDLSIVLEHLLEGRQVRDSAAWLRGEGLPDEVLNSLRLSTPGPDDDPEVSSRHFVMAICELIRPGVRRFLYGSDRGSDEFAR